MISFRERMLQALGTFPQRVDPYIELALDEDAGSYLRYRIGYLVEPGERIKSFLLVPKGKKGRKFPAVFACHQHAVQFHLGKSEVAGMAGDPQMAYGLELCKRGYVVLCQDLLGFEDRRKGEYFQEQYNHSVNLEKILASYYVAEGRCLNTKYLHDITAGVSVLASLDFVDADRIGAIGHSTGGQETLWLAWLDDRIKAAVSSCGFARVRDLRSRLIDHNLAMTVPGMLDIGDLDDLLIDMAPKPFMFTAGRNDPTFPFESCESIAIRVAEHYRALGAEEHFRAVLFEGGHGFRNTVKEEAYAFLDKYLSTSYGDGQSSDKGNAASGDGGGETTPRPEEIT